MFFRRLNWNIVGWFRTVSIISYLIIAAGVGSMIYHGFAGGQGFHANNMMRLGLSFTGGTSVDTVFTKPVTQDQIRTALAGIGVTDERVTTVGQAASGGYTRYSIETGKAFGNDTATLWNALGKVAPVDRGRSQIVSVGPTLGKEYLTKAIEA